MASRCSEPARLAGAMCLSLAVTLTAQAPPEGPHVQSPAQRAADRIRSLQRESDALAVQEKTLLV